MPPWEKYVNAPAAPGPWSKYGAEAPVQGAAEMASQALTPPVDIPQDTSVQGTWDRVLRASKEAVMAPIAPFISSLRGRALSPQVGQYGPSQVLEEEGRRVGGAVRSAADNAANKLAESRFGQAFPKTSAAVGAGLTVGANMTSDTLTPTGAAQAIGGDAILPVIGGTSKLIKGAAVDSARNAMGFQKSQLVSQKSAFETMRKTSQANRAAEMMLDRGDISWGVGKINKNALNLLAEGKKEADDVIQSIDEMAGFKPQPGPEGKAGTAPEAARQSRALPESMRKYLGNPRDISPGSSKGLADADKVLPDLPSYDSRITQTPKYVKAKIEAADVIKKYASARGAEPSNQFYDQLFREMHDEAVDAARKGPEAVAAFEKKFPDFNADFPKITHLRTLRNQYAERIKDFEKGIATIREGDFDKAFSKTISPENDAELTAAVAARRDVSDRMKGGNIALSDLDYLRQYWGQKGFRDKTVGTDQANVYRKAWKAAGEFIKEHIGRVAPDDLPKFTAAMKKQEAAMTGMKGIQNRMAKLDGNDLFTWSGLKNRVPGWSIAANRLNAVSKTAQNLQRPKSIGAFSAMMARVKERENKKK